MFMYLNGAPNYFVSEFIQIFFCYYYFLCAYLCTYASMWFNAKCFCYLNLTLK